MKAHAIAPPEADLPGVHHFDTVEEADVWCEAHGGQRILTDEVPIFEEAT